MREGSATKLPSLSTDEGGFSDFRWNLADSPKSGSGKRGPQRLMGTPDLLEPRFWIESGLLALWEPAQECTIPTLDALGI